MFFITASESERNTSACIKDILRACIYCIYVESSYLLLMDTHSVITTTKQTQALTKSRNMDIWVISTLNQLFVRGFYI